MKKSRNGGKRVLNTPAPRPKKRIFGACILFLTVVLALATAVLATNDQWKTEGSYSLVIEKKFADGTPGNVLAEAEKRDYRFRIEGYWLDAEKNEHPIEDTVTINEASGWKAGPFHADGPIHVSVTEITNDITLNVDGKEYNMGDSRAETSTLFKESPLVRELNNNGKIVLSRPDTKTGYDGNGNEIQVPVTTTSTFRITSKWTASEHAKPHDWQPYNQVVTLEPGKDPIVLDGLQAGEYTIEDLSVSGYTVKLGPRQEDVGMKNQAGDEPSVAAYSAREGEADKQTHGTFYINSYPGKLTITAGGAVNDGGTHYYTVRRVDAPTDARPFVDRTTDAVKSGETYTLDDLPKGQYEVTEYTFTEAPTEFKVKVPEIKDEEKSFNFRNYTAEGKTISRYYITMGGDYVDGFRYGPIYDKNGKMIPESELYNVRYIANWLQTDGSTERKGYSASNRKGTYYYTLKDTIIPGTGDQRLAFGLGETTANKGGYCLLKWTEHTKVQKNYTAKNANTNYSFTIDDRGWMEITAPEKSSTLGAESVTYTYTLRKTADGEALREVTLTPGQSHRFEDLEKGTYLLMETMSFAEPVGFLMDISGGPVGSKEAGKPSEITVMQPRLLTIEKPKGKEGDNRDYTFLIEQAENSAKAARNARAAGEGTEIGAAPDDDDDEKNVFKGELQFPIKVVLRAGEKSLKIPLPAGTYTVTPVDDMTEVFELKCTDSSQVHAEVPSDAAASVTFTNVFTEGSYGYRYVHEYYIKNSDGTYTYEGNSPITTVGGRSAADEFYNSVDITKEKVFTCKDATGTDQTFHYDYMPENNGYGYVDTKQTGGGYEVAPGLRSSNQGTEKDKTTGLYYRVDETLTGNKKIGVDKDKTQIIILRYFRVLPEAQKGSYNYIHIYYRRDAKGDHWEGTSELTNVTGQLNVPYDADTVLLKPDYRPENSEETYHYVHDQRPNYVTLTDDHTAPHIEHELVPGFNDSQDGPKHYHYDSSSKANYVIATKEGNQIIILRYYREVRPEDTIGTYKVVHEYYYQEKADQGGAEEDSGSEGETPGGTVLPTETEPEVTPPANIPGLQEPSENTTAPGGDVTDGEQITESPVTNKPADDSTPSEPGPGDTAGGDQFAESQKPVDNDMDGIIPQESRDGDVSTQEPAGDTPTDDNPIQGAEDSVLPINDSTTEDVDARESSSFNGTLSSNETYIYTFEGARAVETIRAPLGSAHRGDDVEQLKEWTPQNVPEEYTYKDAVYGTANESGGYSVTSNMEWAASTEEGDQIIILRYIRGDDVEPDKPDKPDKPGGGGGGGGGKDPDPTPPPKDPENPPENPENPPEDPENPPENPENPPENPENPPENPENPPKDPEYPTELPDPNDPDSPEEITIWEDGVPKTYKKVWDPEGERWIYVPEEDVPLWNRVPQTGDDSRVGLWAALAVASLCGLSALILVPRKRKNRS